MVIDFSIKILGNKHVIYNLIPLIHWSIRLMIFIDVNMGIIAKSFIKGVES